MGIVHGNWLTGTHSGRACRHENVYTRVNKKTGQCYSAQLCNPNPYRNEKQKKVTTAFSVISAAIAAWIATEKAKSTPSDDFKQGEARLRPPDSLRHHAWYDDGEGHVQGG